MIWSSEVLLFLIVAAALRTPRIARRIGLVTREVVITALASLITVLAFISNHRYLLRFMDADLLTGEWACSNISDVALLLDAYITVCHLLFPVRWHIMMGVDVTVLLVFGTCSFVFEDMVPIHQLVLMAGLTVATSFRGRLKDYQERMQFALVVHERTLRVKAEFKSTATGLNAPRAEELVSCNSVPTTTNTGKMFEAKVGLLEDITTLGRQEHWLIDESELQLEKEAVLGRGGCAIVFRGRFCHGPVAVKVSNSKASELNCCANELRLLRQVRHPNIVLFHGACIEESTQQLLLVLEMLEGTTFHDFMRKGPSQPVYRHRIMCDVCRALIYLHSRRPCIVHCDLKTMNIFIETSYRAKLLDFGLSRAVTHSATHLGGTTRFTAPEHLRCEGTRRLTASADVFSFGRLLYCGATGRKPLKHLSSEDLTNMANNGIKVPDLDWAPQPGHCSVLSQLWCSLSERCTQQEANRRPSITDVLESLESVWEEANPNLSEDGLSTIVPSGSQGRLPMISTTDLGREDVHLLANGRLEGNEFPTPRTPAGPCGGGAAGAERGPAMIDANDPSNISLTVLSL